MEKITVGVLTISDRCSKNQMPDESGTNLIKMINDGIVKNAIVVETSLVPDDELEIKKKLIEWCDKKKMNVIFTTGGTGVAPRDITPEATASVLDRKIPGISNLIFMKSLEMTTLASLSRGISGVRGETLIINFPGSKKASKECLEFISNVIPHAVDVICDVKEKIENVHSILQQKSKVKTVKEDQRERKSPYPCIEVTQAQKIILQKVSEFKREKTVSFEKALGYVLSREVKAADDLPPFDASIKDGYAIQGSDKTSPKTLIGSCAAGVLPSERVLPGYCMSINTGAPLPEGADTVVQIEDTFIVQKECTPEIGITIHPKTGENVRPKGFDFKKGDLLISAGTYLGSSALGLLGAAGILSVNVYQKPSITVMSTGDEIVDPREKPAAGKVRDSNRVAITNMLKEEGFDANDLGIVRDHPDALYSSLAKGFELSDVVITTGSMSMGDKDYLKEVLVVDFGAEILFGRVFMKPGKPTAFASLKFQGEQKFWFGLPGNPASAVVTTHLFVLPALRRISGLANAISPRVEADLTFDIVLDERPNYHRGILYYKEGAFKISSTGNQSSSRVGSCLDANCLIEIPPGAGVVPNGTRVTALLIGKLFQ